MSNFPMTNNTLDIPALKRGCATMLRNNDVKPKTKTGERMIFAYWYGVLRTANETNPFITMCLMSGRYDDLVDMTTEGEQA